MFKRLSTHLIIRLDKVFIPNMFPIRSSLERRLARQLIHSAPRIVRTDGPEDDL